MATVEFRFKVTGWGPTEQRLRDPRFQELIAKNFDVLGRRITYLEKKELRPVRYTGVLEESVQYKVDKSIQEPKVTIGPTAFHTPFVWKGARPRWVPINVLKPWAAIKLGDANLAYPIQRSIAKHGTSQWAAKKYGTSGGNPFPRRTLERGDTQRAIINTAKRIGVDLVARIEG